MTERCGECPVCRSDMAYIVPCMRTRYDDAATKPGAKVAQMITFAEDAREALVEAMRPRKPQ